MLSHLVLRIVPTCVCAFARSSFSNDFATENSDCLLGEQSSTRVKIEVRLLRQTRVLSATLMENVFVNRDFSSTMHSEPMTWSSSSCESLWPKGADSLYSHYNTEEDVKRATVREREKERKALELWLVQRRATTLMDPFYCITSSSVFASEQRRNERPESDRKNNLFPSLVIATLSHGWR